MKEFWSKKAAAITPYVAGEQPKIKNIIKLNTNENPYPPSPKAIEAIKEAANDALRLYPDPQSTIVREAAAALHGVDPENIFCANGSDEALAIAFQAFFDDVVKFPDITYSFYPVWASLYGLVPEIIPLNDDFTIPVKSFLGGCCVIANPNAPTGIPLSLDEIEAIVKAADGVVVIDEAYCDFGGESAVPLVKKYPNVVVIRTLSKSHGLAGLRFGYAIADANLITAMDAIKDSFNSYPIDRLAQAGAAAALADKAYTDNITNIISETRDKYSVILTELGFDVLPSKSNFLFCGHPDAENIMAELRKRGIIVRRFGSERIQDRLRITIGTPEQMDALVNALKEII